MKQTLPRWKPWPRRLLGLALVVYWLALFVATHIPLPPGDGSVNDKSLHLIAYGMLAFWLAMFRAPRFRNALEAWLIIISVCAAYGVLDELLQMVTPSRSADIYDWFADLAGAALGAAVGLLTHRIAIRTFPFLVEPPDTPA